MTSERSKQPSPAYLLEVSALSAGYVAGADILHGVSLDIPTGAFVGIVGPNGCGKSTLIKAITGILARRGQVLLRGNDTARMSRREFARLVAVVEQESDIAFDFSVAEVVAMGRLPHQGAWAGETATDRDAVSEAMKLCKVDALGTRSIRGLSGGERQRVMLAKALAQGPDLLLLDEPTSHLDIGNQLEAMDLIRGLCRARGLTAVAVLHDLNLAAQYCDSIAMMQAGTIFATGDPAAVVTSQNIAEVYGAAARVATSGDTGRPYVVIVPAWSTVAGPRVRDGRPGSIHVVCGGGSGEAVVRALCGAGCHLTVGVLNALDSDAELCESLGAMVVAEAPFSGLSPERLDECREAVLSSRAVVLCPVPFGPGNVANLELAVWAIRQGKAAFLYCPTQQSADFAARDFTGGTATRLLGELVALGATTIGELGELVDRVLGA